MDGSGGRLDGSGDRMDGSYAGTDGSDLDLNGSPRALNRPGSRPSLSYRGASGSRGVPNRPAGLPEASERAPNNRLARGWPFQRTQDPFQRRILPGMEGCYPPSGYLGRCRSKKAQITAGPFGSLGVGPKSRG